MEVGGKSEINNHVIPNSLYGFSINDPASEYSNLSKNDRFHYEDRLSSLYANYSKTFLGNWKPEWDSDMNILIIK